MIRHILFQTTDTDWIQYWEDGDWFAGTFEPFVALLGRPAVVMLLAGPFTLALWIQTESVATPGIFIALFFGLLLTGAPPAVATLGYVIVTVATMVAYRSIFGSG